MPGYVYLVAAVDALGGGLLAIKMIGVASGGLTTAAVYGTARAVFGRAAAIAAGLACALWPAGIAVSSVTGTDMPAAALLATAVWLLVRNAAGATAGRAPCCSASCWAWPPTSARWRCRWRPWRRSIFARGARSGSTRSRARSRPVWWRSWCCSPGGCATAASTASCPSPTATAATPRSSGRTRTPRGGTAARSTGCSPRGPGYKLFAPPHPAADRAAFALAKDWTRLEPAYAAGLLVAKADRLLTTERPLLYWPLYRQSVLPEGRPVAALVLRPPRRSSSSWSTGSGTCWSAPSCSAWSRRWRAATGSRCRCCRCRSR